MALPESIYVESWDVNKRLAELGIKEDALLQAAERGFTAWASCTANHPPAIPGSDFCAAHAPARFEHFGIGTGPGDLPAYRGAEQRRDLGGVDSW